MKGVVFCHFYLFPHQLLVSSLLCDFTILHKDHLVCGDLITWFNLSLETHSVTLAQKLKAVSHQKHSLVLQHHLQRLHRSGKARKCSVYLDVLVEDMLANFGIDCRERVVK